MRRCGLTPWRPSSWRRSWLSLPSLQGGSRPAQACSTHGRRAELSASSPDEEAEAQKGCMAAGQSCSTVPTALNLVHQVMTLLLVGDDGFKNDCSSSNSLYTFLIHDEGTGKLQLATGVWPLEFSPAVFVGPRPRCHLTFKWAKPVDVPYQHSEPKNLWYFRDIEFH